MVDEEFVKEALRQILKGVRNEKRFWWIAPVGFLLLTLGIFSLFAIHPPLKTVPMLLHGGFGCLFLTIFFFKTARYSLKRHQKKTEKGCYDVSKLFQ